MEEIEKIREKTDEIDTAMLRLFEERMECSKELAHYKKEHGIPVLDPEREKQILEEFSAKVRNQKFAPYYIDFLSTVMNISDRFQKRLNEGMKIAFNGETGAFAHIAAKRIFPNALHIPHPSFRDAYAAVEKGECDCAVIPIENSYAGEVGAVMDLMFEGELKLTGTYTLPVTHNLLAPEGVNTEDIDTVMSHPQALAQCEEYINSHHWNTRSVSSTSYAAQLVAQGSEKNVAAIASDEAAEIFGLEVLDHDINKSSVNTTRFAVFSKADYVHAGQKSTNFIMIFTVSNVAGALAKAINIIGENGFNMNALRSRPVKDKAWQYYFYAELEGDDSSEQGKKMLAELAEQCDFIKIVGHYTKGLDLSDKHKYEIKG